MTENFRRCLNKSVIIATGERDTNNCFVPVWVVASYAWNSAPIEGIDILRSIQNIDREFHFTIDINLNALPEMTQIIIKLSLSISNLHIFLTTFPTPFLIFYRRSSNRSC